MSLFDNIFFGHQQFKKQADCPAQDAHLSVQCSPYLSHVSYVSGNAFGLRTFSL